MDYSKMTDKEPDKNNAVISQHAAAVAIMDTG